MTTLVDPSRLITIVQTAAIGAESGLMRDSAPGRSSYAQGRL